MFKCCFRWKCMKACCEVTWDYGLTMSVAILLIKRAKHAS